MHWRKWQIKQRWTGPIAMGEVLMGCPLCYHLHTVATLSFIQISRFIAIHLYPSLQGYLLCNLIYVYTIVHCEWCVRGNFVAIIFYLLLANYYFLSHVYIPRWLWIFGWDNPLWLPFHIILVDGWGIVFILVDHEGRPYVIRLYFGWRLGLPLWDSFQSMW